MLSCRNKKEVRHGEEHAQESRCCLGGKNSPGSDPGQYFEDRLNSESFYLKVMCGITGFIDFSCPTYDALYQVIHNMTEKYTIVDQIVLVSGAM